MKPTILSGAQAGTGQTYQDPRDRIAARGVPTKPIPQAKPKPKKRETYIIEIEDGGSKYEVEWTSENPPNRQDLNNLIGRARQAEGRVEGVYQDRGTVDGNYQGEGSIVMGLPMSGPLRPVPQSKPEEQMRLERNPNPGLMDYLGYGVQAIKEGFGEQVRGDLETVAELDKTIGKPLADGRKFVGDVAGTIVDPYMKAKPADEFSTGRAVSQGIQRLDPTQTISAAKPLLESMDAKGGTGGAPLINSVMGFLANPTPGAIKFLAGIDDETIQKAMAGDVGAMESLVGGWFAFAANFVGVKTVKDAVASGNVNKIRNVLEKASKVAVSRGDESVNVAAKQAPIKYGRIRGENTTTSAIQGAPLPDKAKGMGWLDNSDDALYELFKAHKAQGGAGLDFFDMHNMPDWQRVSFSKRFGQPDNVDPIVSFIRGESPPNVTSVTGEVPTSLLTPAERQAIYKFRDQPDVLQHFIETQTPNAADPKVAEMIRIAQETMGKDAFAKSRGQGDNLEGLLQQSIDMIEARQAPDPLAPDAMTAAKDPDFYTEGGGGGTGGTTPPTAQGGSGGAGDTPKKPMTAMDYAKEASYIARGLKLGADVGALLRQGGEMLINDPIQWARSTKNAFTKTDKAKLTKYYSEMEARTIHGKNMADVRKAAGLKTSHMDTEEAFASKMFDKVPGLNRLENFQKAFLDSGRIERFDSFYRKFPDATDKELRDYAKYLNSAMGKSNVSQVLPALEVLMTAPRWTASRWEMAGRLMRSPVTAAKAMNGNKAAMQEAKNLGRYAMGLYGILQFAESKGAEVEFDPRSSDFLKIRSGEKVFDPTSGISAPIRTALRMMLYARGEDAGFGNSAGNELAKTVINTANPVITTPWGLITQKSLTGFELDEEERGALLMLPLIANGALEAWQKDGKIGTMIQTGTELVGINSLRYPKKKPEWKPRSQAKGDTPMDTDRLRTGTKVQQLMDKIPL